MANQTDNLIYIGLNTLTQVVKNSTRMSGSLVLTLIH